MILNIGISSIFALIYFLEPNKRRMNGECKDQSKKNKISDIVYCYKITNTNKMMLQLGQNTLDCIILKRNGLRYYSLSMEFLTII